MLLAIDVGNTRIKAGLWDGEQWIQSVDVPSTNLGVAELMKMSFGDEQPNVICASVVPHLTSALQETFAPAIVEMPDASWAELELFVSYEPKASLGADRLANVMGVLAQTHWEGGISVDFGTATKIDVVYDDVDDELAYLGGVIMPGLQISAASLSAGTAQLPNIELRSPSSVIGRNTTECIQSGVVLGHAAAVDGLIEKIMDQFPIKLEVFATGGGAELIVPLCKTTMKIVPTLTLNGLVEEFRVLRVHRDS